MSSRDEIELHTITFDEFAELPPEKQATVIERESEHLSYAVQKLWQDGSPSKEDIYEVWRSSKGVYSLAYLHNGLTYKGW